MKQVAVFETRVITCLGDLNQNWSALMAGSSGLGPHAAFPGMTVGAIPALEDPLGRAKRFSQLIDLIALDWPPLPIDTSLVVATTKGAIDEIWQGDSGSRSLGQPWNCGEFIGQRFGLKKGARTVSAACASGTLAIINGAMQIINGEANFVLVVGFDLLSEFVASGFSSLKAISARPCRPFDQNRDGLSLGEGGCAILLGARELGRTHGFKEMAVVSGWGASCDATHITAPSREAVGLIETIGLATKNLKLTVGGINAHGTGTVYNDAMEIYAFSKLWENPPPVHSVKGAIGHCLGAAGLIESAIAIKSLNERTIPPTVGLERPEPQLGQALTGHAVPITTESVLNCNSGFGGINAAVLFSNDPKQK